MAIFSAALVTACAMATTTDRPAREAVRHDGPGQSPLAAIEPDEPVRNLPKARYGNPATYKVFGRQYRVLDTAENYRAEGIASWYGRQFHGRLTSSREPYDMHRFTAAHPSLPLPTFVRVTRTDTGASVVVKVNDRGPFVDDRIIDVSYAAALALDMVDQGTAPVQIQALSTHRQVATAVPPGTEEPEDGLAQVSQPVPMAADTPTPGMSGSGHFVQLGAFASEPNAARLADRLRAGTRLPARVERAVDGSLYRVQVGPLADAGDVQKALARLVEAGYPSESLLVRKLR